MAPPPLFNLVLWRSRRQLRADGLGSSSTVFRRMAPVAQRDQVFFRVLARVAAELLVVNFQVRPGAADLAAPAVAP